jgi:hypothetical protein
MPKRGKVWNSGGASGKSYYGEYRMLFTLKAAILNEIVFSNAWYLGSEVCEAIRNLCLGLEC